MENTLVQSQIKVIQIKSSLDATNKAEFEQELAAALAEESCTNLLVDLEQLQFVDSDGLMILISGFKLAQLFGRRFSLCSVSPAIQIILELTQLDKVFEISEKPGL